MLIHPQVAETCLAVNHFVLMMDNFGIKYEGRQSAQYLIDTLTDYYEIAIDWTGKLFYSVSLKWDYLHR